MRKRQNKEGGYGKGTDDKGKEERNGLDAKTMEVRNRPEKRDWKCKEAGRDAGWLRTRRVWEMCREVSISAGLGKPRGWRGHINTQKCRKLKTVLGEGKPNVGRGAWQDAGAGKKL